MWLLLYGYANNSTIQWVSFIYISKANLAFICNDHKPCSLRCSTNTSVHIWLHYSGCPYLSNRACFVITQSPSCLYLGSSIHCLIPFHKWISVSHLKLNKKHAFCQKIVRVKGYLFNYSEEWCVVIYSIIMQCTSQEYLSHTNFLCISLVWFWLAWMKWESSQKVQSQEQTFSKCVAEWN